MAKKKKEEGEKIELWRGKWFLGRDYPQDKLELLGERYDVIEKWEEKRRKQGPPFNEQFCADVYAVADITTRDDSFKGKFDPEKIYQEMGDMIKEIRKGKEGYSLYDEVKALGMVIGKHKKKTPSK